MGSHEFTPQQTEIIETFGQGQAVMAGAGCGKTTTLVAKCLALLRNDSKSRFCAVSFTEKSVRDLRQALSEGFQDAEMVFDTRAHWVKTIHGLCSTIIQEFPVYAGLQGGEKILVEDESRALWDQTLNLLWSQSENAEITAAVALLLQIYSKKTLETLLNKLRSLMSFGVEHWIQLDRPEVAALWLVFQSVYHRYQHYKNRDGALDFNDLELFALKALENSPVRDYYHQRFELVLVDEFQDTNPIQGKILEYFVKSNYSNLCIVGDPKQSIYRFRDADVTVFTDLTERLPKKHLLDTNYRSRPEVIEFVNEICVPVFQASNLAYEALTPGREPAPMQSGAARVSRLIFEDESSVAQFLKAEEANGVDLSEYVILARSLRREKTQKFLDAFDLAQVPYILGNGGQFYEDPRVQELVAFLKGWISPKNTLSQVIALRAPWIGIEDTQLLSWQDAYYEKFFSESSHPIALTLKESFETQSFLRPGQILEKLWALDSFDDELSLSLVTLWHKAEQLSSQGRRFEEVVNYFSRAIEEKQLEKEIPPPAKSGTVRIMTVHGSKGLQFPRVILLDFSGAFKAPGAGLDLIWDRKHGVYLFIRDEDGKKEADDAENLAWNELEMRARVAESKRLFYVAITRAQEELILAWKQESLEVKAPLKNPPKKPKKEVDPFLQDNWRLWVETVSLPAERLWTRVAASANGAGVPGASFKKYTPVKFDSKSYRPRHSPSEWMILNQCALRYQRSYLETMLDEGAPEAEPSGTDPSSVESVAETGERIHSLIEKEQWEELVAEFKTPEQGRRVVDSLQQILNPSLFVKPYKELGFEIPLSDVEALVGMMDRLEIDEANHIIRVIDYKWTNRARPGAELLEHYLLQLQLYAWAASKLVLFAPKKVEAALIHLTSDEINTVWAPSNEFDLAEIEIKVQSLFQKSKSALALVQQKQNNPATLGTHCRYCESQASCPDFTISARFQTYK